MEKDLQELTERLGHDFIRKDLLFEAFRHSSYVNEIAMADLQHNERLEFLGDAVLDLAISHILMERFKDTREGDLTKYRAAVVSEKALSRVARKLNLGRYLQLGKGEERSKGREKPSILADSLESLLGAIYLDAGFDKTMRIIENLFLPLIEQINLKNAISDYKSLLQEYSQEMFKKRPEYLVVEERGPAHNKTFRVALRLNGEIMAEGEGKSKKEAEQKVAKEVYDCLTRDQKKER